MYRLHCIVCTQVCEVNMTLLGTRVLRRLESQRLGRAEALACVQWVLRLALTFEGLGIRPVGIRKGQPIW